MPCIFHDEEESDLSKYLPGRGKGYGGGEAAILRHWVEKPGYKLGVEGQQMQIEGVYQIWGSSTVKWLSRTSMAQFHCSFAVGILCWISRVSIFCSSDVRGWRTTTYILNLPLPKVWDQVNDDPRQAASKVHSLVPYKAHDASGEDVVLHVRIPRRPQLLKVVERDIVLGDLVELAPVGINPMQRVGGGGVPASVPISIPVAVCWERASKGESAYIMWR
jgi:hypothetical protein